MEGTGHHEIAAAVPPALGSPYDDLYDQHARLLRFLAGRKFHVPPADVETLVQDAFLAYLCDPESIRNPRAYLVGAVCNASKKYWEKHHRERQIFSEDAPEAFCVDDPTLEKLTDQLAMRATMAKLDDRCRKALFRFHVDRESASAIADTYRTTPGYVHKLLHSCRKRAVEIFRTLTRLPS